MNNALLKTQPHSINAERSVIGALLLDSDAFFKIDSTLTPNDFFDPVYRDIFGVMQELSEEGIPVDFVTVADRLSDSPRLQQIGGSSFLAELPCEVPTASHVEQYADMLKARTTRREMLKLSKEVAALAEDNDTPTSELIDNMEQRLFALGYATTKHKPVATRDMHQERYDHYVTVHEAKPSDACFGIQTGFSDLDQMIVGLNAGDVMVLAGRPSMGKTAIALEMARNVAEVQNKRVTIFSLEMSKEQLFNRLFASFHGVDEHKLSRGELDEAEIRGLGDTFERIEGLNLDLDDDPDKTISNLRSKARRHKMEHGIDLLIIDYLQLIQVPSHVSSRQNRTEEMRFVSEQVKALARDIDVPVIALSQLSREVERRNDRRPVLSDLRESGAIEQDADYVAMLYRDGYYDEDCDHPELTDLYLRKNRPHGQTGQVALRFDKDRYRFDSVDQHHSIAA